jgi:hypothetical protein
MPPTGPSPPGREPTRCPGAKFRTCPTVPAIRYQIA